MVPRRIDRSRLPRIHRAAWSLGSAARPPEAQALVVDVGAGVHDGGEPARHALDGPAPVVRLREKERHLATRAREGGSQHLYPAFAPARADAYGELGHSHATAGIR